MNTNANMTLADGRYRWGIKTNKYAMDWKLVKDNYTFRVVVEFDCPNPTFNHYYYKSVVVSRVPTNPADGGKYKIAWKNRGTWNAPVWSQVGVFGAQLENRVQADILLNVIYAAYTQFHYQFKNRAFLQISQSLEVMQRLCHIIGVEEDFDSWGSKLLNASVGVKYNTYVPKVQDNTALKASQQPLKLKDVHDMLKSPTAPKFTNGNTLVWSRKTKRYTYEIRVVMEHSPQYFKFLTISMSKFDAELVQNMNAYWTQRTYYSPNLQYNGIDEPTAKDLIYHIAMAVYEMRSNSQYNISMSKPYITKFVKQLTGENVQLAQNTENATAADRIKDMPPLVRQQIFSKLSTAAKSALGVTSAFYNRNVDDEQNTKDKYLNTLRAFISQLQQYVSITLDEYHEDDNSINLRIYYYDKYGGFETPYSMSFEKTVDGNITIKTADEPEFAERILKKIVSLKKRVNVQGPIDFLR